MGSGYPPSMWDRPRPEIEPEFPALEGRFLTTGPARKSFPHWFEPPFGLQLLHASLSSVQWIKCSPSGTLSLWKQNEVCVIYEHWNLKEMWIILRPPSCSKCSLPVIKVLTSYVGEDEASDAWSWSTLYLHQRAPATAKIESPQSIYVLGAHGNTPPNSTQYFPSPLLWYSHTIMPWFAFFDFCLWFLDLALGFFFPTPLFKRWGFPGGSDSKESTCNVGDPGSIPG